MSADNWSRIGVLSEVRSYGLAIAACALALAVALPIDAPSSCFFLAITVSALYGGKGPGILSALAFNYFFQHHAMIDLSAYPRFVADRVFDAFFTTKENGLGMGLAICHSIIEAHEGRLWVSSVEAPGTAFSFTLPVKAPRVIQATT